MNTEEHTSNTPQTTRTKNLRVVSRKLLWKLFLTFVTGVVAMFYLLDYLTSKAENAMSLLAAEHRQQIEHWGEQAEALYLAGNTDALASWLQALQQKENTSAAVMRFHAQPIVPHHMDEKYYLGHNFGRSVDWAIHLHFEERPLMEVPFSGGEVSFLIVLPQRMLPGRLWHTTKITLQVVLPMGLLALLCLVLYRHIMRPLAQLRQATQAFSRGDYSTRVAGRLGNRSDELFDLAVTFDQMAERIGRQLVSQRQLISDLSHELRTPLTRLDIAVEAARHSQSQSQQTMERAASPLPAWADATAPETGGCTAERFDLNRCNLERNLARVAQESGRIRRLVEDTLHFAWLENERPSIRSQATVAEDSDRVASPSLESESLDLVDLIDVIIEDARFEFPHSNITAQLPPSAVLPHSNHRVLGPALENILRNALRYTPPSGEVRVCLDKLDNGEPLNGKPRSQPTRQSSYRLRILDQGPGIPNHYLEAIFEPFFRVESSRSASGPSANTRPSAQHNSFGLGLALARRQLHAVGATVVASNRPEGGLCMTVTLPLLVSCT